MNDKLWKQPRKRKEVQIPWKTTPRKAHLCWLIKTDKGRVFAAVDPLSLEQGTSDNLWRQEVKEVAANNGHRCQLRRRRCGVAGVCGWRESCVSARSRGTCTGRKCRTRGSVASLPGLLCAPVTSEMQGTWHMPTVSTGASSSLLLFPSRGPFPADTQDRNSSLFQRGDKN